MSHRQVFLQCLSIAEFLFADSTWIFGVQASGISPVQFLMTPHGFFQYKAIPASGTLETFRHLIIVEMSFLVLNELNLCCEVLDASAAHEIV
jgi:hypothetical protein